jgi:hypothetical protein
MARPGLTVASSSEPVRGSAVVSVAAFTDAVASDTDVVASDAVASHAAGLPVVVASERLAVASAADVAAAVSAAVVADAAAAADTANFTHNQ